VRCASAPIPAVHGARGRPPLDDDAQVRFELLRRWRAAEAKEQGVPAYVIFPDRTLASIAAAPPADRDDLLAVSGVGATKLERYGDAVMRVLTEAVTP